MTPNPESLVDLLPAELRDRMEPPDRARNEKATARFTAEKFRLLRRLARERQEKVSAVVRKLALATIDEVAD